MNLNETKLYKALEKNPSYFKKGKEFLSQRFGVTPSEVTQIKLAIRATNPNQKQYTEEIVSESVNTEKLGLPIKTFKKWQNASGKWLESYQYGNAIDNTPEQSLEEFETKLIDHISQISPKTFKKIPPTNGQISLVINAADIHLQQLGKDSMQLRGEVLIDKINQILQRTNHLDLGEIVLVFNGDTFNSENCTQRTVKGTPQYDSVKWSEAFTYASGLIIDIISLLSEYAPVKFINVGGNHDNTTSWMLGQVIQAYFRNDHNVFTLVTDAPFKFYEWGCNSLMFNHGELKTAEYPVIFMTEAPELFARTTTHEICLGHQHRQSTFEFRGVIVRYLPSLIEPSSWAEEQGYKQRQAIQGLLYHETEGFYGLIESSK